MSATAPCSTRTRSLSSHSSRQSPVSAARGARQETRVRASPMNTPKRRSTPAPVSRRSLGPSGFSRSSPLLGHEAATARSRNPVQGRLPTARTGRAKEAEGRAAGVRQSISVRAIGFSRRSRSM